MLIEGCHYENSAGKYLLVAKGERDATLFYLSGDVNGLLARLPLERLIGDWRAIRAREVHPDLELYRGFLQLPGLYFICHIANLKNILTMGLLAKNHLSLEYADISESGVQELRSSTAIILECPPGKRRRGSLHDFVPLYFNPIGPMVYSRRRLLQQLVVIEVNPHVLDLRDTLFTSGNAAMQGSRKRSGWQTIVSASCDGRPCKRRYVDEGIPSSGTTNPVSDVYHGQEHLARLPWEIIYGQSWGYSDDARRARAAEVLVPRRLPATLFQRLILPVPALQAEVRRTVSDAGLGIDVVVGAGLHWPAP